MPWRNLKKRRQFEHAGQLRLLSHAQCLFFTQQQKGPCLLSGVNVNDEREYHPSHVETRVNDRKRYLILWARGFRPCAVRSFQRKAC